MDNSHFGYKPKILPPQKKKTLVVTCPEEAQAEFSRGR
jgi:hypothetical protein